MISFKVFTQVIKLEDDQILRNKKFKILIMMSDGCDGDCEAVIAWRFTIRLTANLTPQTHHILH